MPLIGRGGQGRGRHGLGVGGLILATVALIALGTANASQLGLAPAHLSAATAGHPCPGTAAAESATRWNNSSYYYAVDLAVPAGCASMPVQLAMTGAGGTLTGDGMASAAGEVRVDVGWYDASRAYTFLATVDGWDLPVAWAEDLAPYIWCTVVDNPTAQCTATVTLFHGTKPGGGEFDYYDVLVTTSSATYVEWEVGFNLAHQFYGTAPETLGNSTLDGFWDGLTNWSGDDADVERVSQCSEYPGLLSVRGESHGTANNYEDVQNNRARSFSLVLDYQQGTYDDLVPATCSP